MCIILSHSGGFMSQTCKEKGCQLPLFSNGFCRLHYIKYWKCIKLGVDPFDGEKRDLLINKDRFDETWDSLIRGDDLSWEAISEDSRNKEDANSMNLFSDFEQGSKEFRSIKGYSQ